MYKSVDTLSTGNRIANAVRYGADGVKLSLGFDPQKKLSCDFNAFLAKKRAYETSASSV